MEIEDKSEEYCIKTMTSSILGQSYWHWNTEVPATRVLGETSLHNPLHISSTYHPHTPSSEQTRMCRSDARRAILLYYTNHYN